MSLPAKGGCVSTGVVGVVGAGVVTTAKEDGVGITRGNTPKTIPFNHLITQHLRNKS